MWLLAEANSAIKLLEEHRPTGKAVDDAPLARLASYAAIVYLAGLKRGRDLRRIPTASQRPPAPGSPGTTAQAAGSPAHASGAGSAHSSSIAADGGAGSSGCGEYNPYTDPWRGIVQQSEREVPLLLWDGLRFFTQLLLGTKGWFRLRLSGDASSSPAPLLAAALPPLLTACVQLMRHSAPLTRDPLRDYTAQVIVVATKYSLTPWSGDSLASMVRFLPEALLSGVDEEAAVLAGPGAGEGKKRSISERVRDKASAAFVQAAGLSAVHAVVRLARDAVWDSIERRLLGAGAARAAADRTLDSDERSLDDASVLTPDEVRALAAVTAPPSAADVAPAPLSLSEAASVWARAQAALASSCTVDEAEALSVGMCDALREDLVHKLRPGAKRTFAQAGRAPTGRRPIPVLIDPSQPIGGSFGGDSDEDDEEEGGDGGSGGGGDGEDEDGGAPWMQVPTRKRLVPLEPPARVQARRDNEVGPRMETMPHVDEEDEDGNEGRDSDDEGMPVIDGDDSDEEDQEVELGVDEEEIGEDDFEDFDEEDEEGGDAGGQDDHDDHHHHDHDHDHDHDHEGVEDWAPPRVSEIRLTLARLCETLAANRAPRRDGLRNMGPAMHGELLIDPNGVFGDGDGGPPALGGEGGGAAGGLGAGDLAGQPQPDDDDESDDEDDEDSESDDEDDMQAAMDAAEDDHWAPQVPHWHPAETDAVQLLGAPVLVIRARQAAIAAGAAPEAFSWGAKASAAQVVPAEPLAATQRAAYAHVLTLMAPSTVIDSPDVGGADRFGIISAWFRDSALACRRPDGALGQLAVPPPALIPALAAKRLAEAAVPEWGGGELSAWPRRQALLWATLHWLTVQDATLEPGAAQRVPGVTGEPAPARELHAGETTPEGQHFARQITAGFARSALLQRATSWAAHRTLPLLTLGMQAYARGACDGAWPLHPALPSPLLSSPALAAMYGLPSRALRAELQQAEARSAWRASRVGATTWSSSTGDPQVPDSPWNVVSEVLKEPLERDRLGFIPPAWLSSAGAAGCAAAVTGAFLGTLRAGDATLTDGATSEPGAVSQRAVHRLVHGLATFCHSFPADCGPFLALTDLVPRLVAIGGSAHLGGLTYMQSSLANVLHGVLRHRPHLLSACDAPSNVGASMVSAMAQRLRAISCISPRQLWLATRNENIGQVEATMVAWWPGAGPDANAEGDASQRRTDTHIADVSGLPTTLLEDLRRVFAPTLPGDPTDVLAVVPPASGIGSVPAAAEDPQQDVAAAGVFPRGTRLVIAGGPLARARHVPLLASFLRHGHAHMSALDFLVACLFTLQTSAEEVTLVAHRFAFDTAFGLPAAWSSDVRLVPEMDVRSQMRQLAMRLHPGPGARFLLTQGAGGVDDLTVTLKHDGGACGLPAPSRDGDGDEQDLIGLAQPAPSLATRFLTGASLEALRSELKTALRSSSAAVGASAPHPSENAPAPPSPLSAAWPALPALPDLAPGAPLPLPALLQVRDALRCGPPHLLSQPFTATPDARAALQTLLPQLEVYLCRVIEAGFALTVADWQRETQTPTRTLGYRLSSLLPAAVLGGRRRVDFTWAVKWPAAPEPPAARHAGESEESDLDDDGDDETGGLGSEPINALARLFREALAGGGAVSAALNSEVESIARSLAIRPALADGDPTVALAKESRSLTPWFDFAASPGGAAASKGAQSRLRSAFLDGCHRMQTVLVPLVGHGILSDNAWNAWADAITESRVNRRRQVEERLGVRAAAGGGGGAAPVPAAGGPASPAAAAVAPAPAPEPTPIDIDGDGRSVVDEDEAMTPSSGTDLLNMGATVLACVIEAMSTLVRLQAHSLDGYGGPMAHATSSATSSLSSSSSDASTPSLPATPMSLLTQHAQHDSLSAERWSRVFTVILTLLIRGDVAGNPRLYHDEEAYDGDTATDRSDEDGDGEDDSDDEEEDGGSDEEEREDGSIGIDIDEEEEEEDDGDGDSAAVGSDVEGGSGAPGPEAGDDGDAAAGGAGADGANDDDAFAAEEMAYDDLLYRDTVPAVFDSLTDVLSLALQKLPLPVLRPALTFVSIPAVVRVVLMRPNVQVASAHNYFVLVAIALSGRVPELTGAVRDQLASNATLRCEWLAHMKSLLMRPEAEGATFCQGALALAMAMDQCCVHPSGGAPGAVMRLYDEPGVLAGGAPLLVSPAAESAGAGSGAGAASSSGSTAGPSGSFPRRAGEARDLALPDWLLQRPHRALFLAGGEAAASNATRNSRGAADFIVGMSAFPFEDDAGSDTDSPTSQASGPTASWSTFELLFRLISPAVADAGGARHWLSSDLTANELQALTTSLARLARLYHASLASLAPQFDSPQGAEVLAALDAQSKAAVKRARARKNSNKKRVAMGPAMPQGAAAARLATLAHLAPAARSTASGEPTIVHSLMYVALARCGGFFEAMRQGWTAVPRPASVVAAAEARDAQGLARDALESVVNGACVGSSDGASGSSGGASSSQHPFVGSRVTEVLSDWLQRDQPGILPVSPITPAGLSPVLHRALAVARVLKHRAGTAAGALLVQSMAPGGISEGALQAGWTSLADAAVSDALMLRLQCVTRPALAAPAPAFLQPFAPTKVDALFRRTDSDSLRVAADLHRELASAASERFGGAPTGFAATGAVKAQLEALGVDSNDAGAAAVASRVAKICGSRTPEVDVASPAFRAVLALLTAPVPAPAGTTPVTVPAGMRALAAGYSATLAGLFSPAKPPASMLQWSKLWDSAALDDDDDDDDDEGFRIVMHESEVRLLRAIRAWSAHSEATLWDRGAKNAAVQSQLAAVSVTLAWYACAGLATLPRSPALPATTSGGPNTAAAGSGSDAAATTVERAVPALAGPLQTATHFFRLSVCEDSVGFIDEPGQGLDGVTPAERVRDGWRWLANMLWMWRLVESGPMPPPPTAAR